MKNPIHPCLWFDGQAKEAASFYCTLFPNSSITVDTPMVVNWELDGFKLMGLNGGPNFKFTPAISLFVSCDTDAEIEMLWEKLSENGSVMMPLGSYPWSPKYAWLSDKYGLSWQLMMRDENTTGPKIIPCFLFVNELYGRGEEAISFYTSLFENSGKGHIQLYDAKDPQQEGKLMHGQFKLTGVEFSAMDGMGEHHFGFNESVSFVVSCDNQQEIDYFWDKLTEGGEESQCGWLKDKFGISWQIIPAVLGELMTDTERSPRVMQAFLKMKKFDIETLLNA